MNFLRAAIAFALLPGTAAAEPSQQLIDEAQRALSECELASPELVLSRQHLARLTEVQHKARHWVINDDYWNVAELATLKQLRFGSDFSMSAVYRADCVHSWGIRQRDAFSRMTPADAVVVGDIAFVAWLDRRGDYTGAGLVFVRERSQWRWQGTEWNAFVRRVDALDVAALDTNVVVEDEDAYFDLCLAAMPPAPESISDFEFDSEHQDFDEDNALGAAKRKAAWLAARGAFGVPSATAKVLLAEVLIRSLEFEDAPDISDPRWRARIERAERLIAEARTTNIDWSRMGGILEWLARAHERGLGGLSVDPVQSKSLRSLVTDSGYVSEKLIPNEFWKDGLPWIRHFEPIAEELRCGT